MSDVVEIIRDLTPQIVEVIQDLQPTIVEVAARGPQGPSGPAGAAGATGPAGAPGPAGPNTIGGYGFSIDGEIDGDVLGFNGASWYNRRQETLSDGGNF